MKLLTIALTYLKQTFTSRSVLLFSVLMPILFTAVLGVAMQGLGPPDEPPRWTLLLADEDRSPQSALLRRRLEADPTLRVVAVPTADLPGQVEANEAPAGLVIPAGFGAALLEGRPVELRFYRAAGRLLDAQAVEAATRAALSALEGSAQSAALARQVSERLGLPAPAPASSFEQARALWETEAPLEVRAEAVTRLKGSEIPLGAEQSSPGMLVMFVLFVTFGGGTTLLAERERGTLRRLLVMPLGKATLIGGKLLGIYLSALVQMSLMVGFGRVLGVNWGQAPGALAAMLLAYGFAATALGILVAALARTSAQADALSTVVVMVLASLGGAWWPIEIVPPWMQTLAQALPTYWGMRGFQDIVVRGLGLEAVLPEVGVLVAFGAAFLLLGLWRFRWE